jgi:hypothetical protein
VNLIGPGVTTVTPMEIGIYIPMRAGVSGDFGDVQIVGFRKGLVLYGGEEAKERYHEVGMTQVHIRQCGYGIFQQAFEKRMRAADIQIFDCEIDDNAPGQIRQASDHR